MEVDSNINAEEKMEEDLARYRQERKIAAQSLYHYGDNDTINSTRSVHETDIVYHEIHGRRYCGEYYMPCDEDEQTRMWMLHEVYFDVLGARLTTVPVDNPTRILDVGTGCGDWAIAMGEEYPQAEVIGTDIAKIQPSAVPPNVFFEIDDAEEESGWTYSDDNFDLVHFRSMKGAFRDWNQIYKETYQHLKPGGWIEVIDFDDNQATLSFLPPGGAASSWLAAVDEGSRKAGRPRCINHLQHEKLTDLGFVDVTTEEYNMPLGIWPEDPGMKKTGKLFMYAQVSGIVPFCLRVLTEQMGWDPVEVMRICTSVSHEMLVASQDSEKVKGFGFLLRVMKGRKPTREEQDAA